MQEKEQETGFQAQQGLWICVVTSTLLVAAMLNAGPLFALAGADPQAAQIGIDYMEAVAWGMPAVVFYVALRHVCEGLGHTRPPMLIAGTVLPLNALLNYAFIYGEFGFPELGGVGCGWATAIVFWTELLLMMLVVRQPFFRATNFLGKLRGPDWPTIRNIVRVGAPIGLTVFLEMAVFSVVALLIAGIGVNEMAAHTIAGNLNWLTYVIPMSLGSAASIRVGFHVGAQDLDAARATSATVFKFAIGYALVVSVLLISLRYVLIGVYTTDQEVIEVAAILLLFIAVYQLVDDSQAVTIGALRGYKDTRVPMYFGLVGYWVVALPLGHALAQEWIFPGLAPGVYGYWAGLTMGLALVAICAGLRLRYTSSRPQHISRLAAL